MKKTIIIFVFAICFVQAKAAIQHIRWGSSGNPLTGLTITWRNTGTSDSIKWGYTNILETGKFAGIIRTGYADYLFNYTFPNVTPNSTIYYKLYNSDTKVWDAQRTYKTAPDPDLEKYTFLALGDSRSDMLTWSQIAAKANSKNSDFALFTGDVVNSGAVNSDWNEWYNNGTQYIQNNIIYHCLGNHDNIDPTKYLNNFEMPQANGSKLYYSFTYGNSVFICLNSENPATAQYNWLINTLQANQSKRWKVVFFHSPFFSIGPHGKEMNNYLNTWWKAFDDYGVDIIFNGHDHMYERTKPINRNISTSAPVATYGSNPGQGRCQIVCGGAGAPLYTGTANWFIEKYQSKYNFCKININGTELIDSTFDNTGALIETFTIAKITTGIESKNKIFNQISVLPNPTEGNFTLKYNSSILGDAFITIFDLEGKKITQEKVIKSRNELMFKYDIRNYSKGVYTIEVQIGKQKDNALLILK